MSPAMAARWALVCALIASLGGTAVAERRPVAVVNLDLADESAAKKLADELEEALRNHPDLQPLNATAGAALKDPIQDPDAVPLARAREYLRRAEDALAAFNYGQAESDADDGRNALHGVTPPLAVKLYADLTFVRGLAFHEEGKLGQAAVHFALVARLDPSRTLDPARYLPAVVKAFAQATSTPAPLGSIMFAGKGLVWIDGAEVGGAPGGFAVPSGDHVVWLYGADRNVAGTRVTVLPNKPTDAPIPDDPLTDRQKYQRARIALAQAAGDDIARTVAMNSLAKLLKVNDAVILKVSHAGSGDKVVVQTWRGGNGLGAGWSAIREHGTEKPVDLLAPIAPPKKIVVEPPFVPLKPVVVKKWYQRRPVQVGLVAGAVATVIGIYFAAQAGADFFNLDHNIQWDTGQVVRQ